MPTRTIHRVGLFSWLAIDEGGVPMMCVFRWSARLWLWKQGAFCGTLDREQSREEMRQILVCWNASQLEQLQEVANAILDDRGATVTCPE